MESPSGEVIVNYGIVFFFGFGQGSVNNSTESQKRLNQRRLFPAIVILRTDQHTMIFLAILLVPSTVSL